MKRVTTFIERWMSDLMQLRLRYQINRRRKSISQMGQDFWVSGEVFNRKQRGFFVEIGSADGITLNNTFLLETRFNWDGICIEADPESFARLEKVRKVGCLNICLDEGEGEVDFKTSGLLGGIVSEDTDNKPSSDTSGVIRCKTKSLESVLTEIEAPNVVDYLSIDCEGAEERILMKFPFEKYRFRAITIERPSEKLRELFSRHQYLLVKEIPGLDAFYIHSDFEESYHKNTVQFWASRPL
jgi:FkbM family methyltransferase